MSKEMNKQQIINELKRLTNEEFFLNESELRTIAGFDKQLSVLVGRVRNDFHEMKTYLKDKIETT